MGHIGNRTDAFDERIHLSDRAKNQIDLLGLSEKFVRMFIARWARRIQTTDYAILKAGEFEIRVRRIGRGISKHSETRAERLRLLRRQIKNLRNSKWIVTDVRHAETAAPSLPQRPSLSDLVLDSLIPERPMQPLLRSLATSIYIENASDEQGEVVTAALEAMLAEYGFEMVEPRDV
ncbi:MAG TPA: hypothetical protein VEX86_00185 [Longimicrobium sp.]|nr:hypothetical protein [Longimicrobium sp.]